MTLTEDQLRARFPNASDAFLRANGHLPPSSPAPAPARPSTATEQPTKKRIRQSAKPLPSESAEQQALVKWWDANCAQWGCEPDDLMAFPLQGARTARNGARMKAEGMRKGTPDLLLAVPNDDWYGLFIEMKSDGGRTTDNQDLAIARLRRRGFCAVVCRGHAAARRTLLDYFQRRS
jgi:hypothetical protein